jgi:methylmalonyl-CoA mutase cobalamin-binding subunit
VGAPALQMRIAIVANTLGLAGAERRAALWARACAALGHEVVIAVLASLGRQYEVPEAIDVASLGKSHTADLPRVVRRLRAVTRDRHGRRSIRCAGGRRGPGVPGRAFDQSKGLSVRAYL